MNLLRKLLIPFVPLYYLGALLNKKLYDWNLKKSTFYNFPVLTVGNLTVGGTGKSPMVSYLINLISKNYSLATLSRGYKRSSKGFQLVEIADKAIDVGDEPLQFKTNFPEIIVAVDEDRRNGIQMLKDLKKVPQVIILDDAFQHRKVKAGFQILLTAYYNLYTDDMLLPTGDLREPISAAKRANTIIVTKCPSNLSSKEQKTIINKLSPQKNQAVYFTAIKYATQVVSKLKKIQLEDFLKQEFTLITGIANPSPLLDFLKSKGAKLSHEKFNDHHNFSAKEIEAFSNKKLILTTEKDYMRLKSKPQLEKKLFYLPIEVSFLNKEETFNSEIESFINQNL